MACVGPLPQLAERLIDLANAAGGHDNVTCIVADFDGEVLDPPDAAALPFYQQYPLPRGGDESGAPPGPTLPHVVRSMVPRAATARKRPSLPERGESAPVRWSTAAAVLALLGLAAAIAVGAGRGVAPDAAPPPAYADAEAPIEVHVRAALEQGELFVNGRSYGPLRDDEAILLRLLPGAYHIEAREADGTQVGKDVVVRPGLPEVVLIPPTD